MKRSEMINTIRFGFVFQKTIPEAETILKVIEDAGMKPVSERTGFSGTATIYKWEEDITENDWSRAFDDIGRD